MEDCSEIRDIFWGVLLYIVQREDLRIPGLDLAALFCTGV